MSETSATYNASTDDEYEKMYQEQEDNLKPLLTPEFLDTLTKAVKTCGWTVDHTESTQFVEWCFQVAGKEAPDLEPYERKPK